MAAQKGGVGKTTISAHLGVEAGLQGHGRVALIDTDPQGSLTDWWNSRQAEAPAMASVSLAQLPDQLRNLKGQGFDLVIIDTPPALTENIVMVLQVADLVLIPTRPSPIDLRAAGKTVDLVDALGKPMVFVLNAVKPRTRLAAASAVLLSQHGTVAPVSLHDRIDFATAFTEGYTAQEIDPQSAGAGEMRELWTYIWNRLNRRRPT
jgi:chromosome partitioning protein